MRIFDMNSVDSLLKKPFSSRTLEERVEVKNLGRPTPYLTIVQQAIVNLVLIIDNLKEKYTNDMNGCVDVKFETLYFVSLAYCLGVLIPGRRVA